MLTLLPEAEAWAPLPSLPRVLYGPRASIVGGLLRVLGGLDEVSAHVNLNVDSDVSLWTIVMAQGIDDTCQVLEYHPEPWNQWLKIGNLQIGRGGHAVLSIGPNQLPCLLGKSYFANATNDACVKLEN